MVSGSSNISSVSTISSQTAIAPQALSGSASTAASRPDHLPLPHSPSQPFGPILDSEALIKFDLDILTPESPTRPNQQDTLHIASLQFNSLDFVG